MVRGALERTLDRAAAGIRYGSVLALLGATGLMSTVVIFAAPWWAWVLGLTNLAATVVFAVKAVIFARRTGR